jgi:formate dehydrogenase major subunit
VWSKRGAVKAKAVVTKRIVPLICDGKQVHIIGIPLHWGFIGETKEGFGPNSLTPYVGDANYETWSSRHSWSTSSRLTGPTW